MSGGVKAIRRVVVGNNADGRSYVQYDGPAPCVNAGGVRPGKAMTDIWMLERCPAALAGLQDYGNRPFHFEPPPGGTVMRIVQSPAKPTDYDAATDDTAVPLHAPKQRHGGTWERGGANAYTSNIHKSATVDYGILLDGERILITDDGERLIRPGDIVVQLGSWHAWSTRGPGALMAFVMMDADMKPPAG